MRARNRKKLIGLALIVIACVVGCYAPEYEGPEKNTIFTSNAGWDSTVMEGDTVALEGSAHHSKKELSYEWTQLSGPSVTIIDITLYWGYARFVSPPVSSTTSLKFRFTARTPSGNKKSDSVTVIVEPTSTFALCLEAPLNATSYAWTSSGCTTNSSEIVGDSRVATLYRQGEAEPNDSLQAANSMLFPAQISTERIAANIDGSVHSADGDSEDYFIFTPPKSGDYQFFLCNGSLACLRGTVTGDWFLMLYDQDFNFITSGHSGLGRVRLVQLSAGLPYYVGVISENSTLEYWRYNLTVISD